MDSTKIIEILAYTFPSIITGLVAYYLFDSYFKDQLSTRKWLMQKDSQNDIVTLRLQVRDTSRRRHANLRDQNRHLTVVLFEVLQVPVII